MLSVSGELERFFKRVADGYLDEADHGRFHSLTTQPMGAQAVLATLTWQLLRRDGKRRPRMAAIL
jgi:hypothetical protein